MQRSAARRIEARAAQLQLDLDSQALQIGRPAQLEILEGRRPTHVRAAGQLERRVCLRQAQRQVQGVQELRDCAGSADVKSIRPRANAAGEEFQLSAADVDRTQHAAANRGGRPHAHEVLASQAGLGAVDANVAHPQWPARDDGQRERRAQDLASSIALRSVDFHPVSHDAALEDSAALLARFPTMWSV